MIGDQNRLRQRNPLAQSAGAKSGVRQRRQPKGKSVGWRTHANEIRWRNPLAHCQSIVAAARHQRAASPAALLAARATAGQLPSVAHVLAEVAGELLACAPARSRGDRG